MIFYACKNHYGYFKSFLNKALRNFSLKKITQQGINNDFSRLKDLLKVFPTRHFSYDII